MNIERCILSQFLHEMRSQQKVHGPFIILSNTVQNKHKPQRTTLFQIQITATLFTAKKNNERKKYLIEIQEIVDFNQ